MKVNSLGTANGLDRIATPDEIRAALALFDDISSDQKDQECLEIPFDCGGYVRVPIQELEFLSLLEEANIVKP